MPFKLTRHSNISTETPEALFRDLRNRQVEGLLAHQADILREYHKQALNSPNVALQLPTGSGKTLVGLLIGEWRRRRFKEKVVYLCPTRQLVNQVVEQSLVKYGIKANTFVGKQADYFPESKAEYLNAESVAVTTYKGGELERISGIEKIVRLTISEDWDKQGIGRRLLFFPEISLDEESALKLIIEMIKSTPRTLVLVPDARTAADLRTVISKETGYEIFDADQIEQSKRTFVSKEKAVAVVVNRYDGIDLVGDEGRLLIIKDLQRATNLQEQFIVNRIAASVLLNDRILTRIIQAVGRCTRSATDYAAVVILGDEL
ncbi:MAG: hypothetical protein Fur006_66890 [Coleofasciculaceae cyanobacterium]